MDRTHYKTRARITGSLAGVLAVLVFAASAPIAVPEANAQFGIPTDTIELPGPLLAATVAGSAAQVTTAVNTTLQTTGVAPKNILDALAWTVAKTAVQSITRSIVNWINSGFNGSPAFVSDLRQNLSNLGDAIADDFLNHLDKEVIGTTGFSIRSPFQDQIQQKLRNEFYQTTASYGINNFYTLNKTTADPSAFLKGDFNQGGFNAFYSASQNQANNPFGAYTAASNQLWAQIDQAAQARKAELGWSKGVLPWRGSCGTNTTGKAVSLSSNDKCLFGSVKTPGAVIETQLEGALGTGIRQLELADSINEIVAALIGQMVNQVLGSGGLAGLSQPAPGGGQSYIDQAASQSSYNPNVAQSVLTSIAKDRTNAITYQTSWQTILNTANTAKTTCSVSDITDAINTASKNVDRAGKALIKIDSINKEINNAAVATTTGGNQNVAITTALADYQSYLTSQIVPTDDEAKDAKFQASDSGDATPVSLYTKLQKEARTCSTTSS